MTCFNHSIMKGDCVESDVAQREVDELARFVEMQRQQNVAESSIRLQVLNLLTVIKLSASIDENVTVGYACLVYRLTAGAEAAGAIDLIEEWWPDKPLSEIDDNSIREYFAYLARAGAGEALANRGVRCLKALFGLAIAAGVSLEVPLALQGAAGWMLPEPAGQPTVGTACAEYSKSGSQGFCARSTASDIALYWKDTPLAEVDDRRVLRYIAWLKGDVAFADHQVRLRLEHFRKVLESQGYVLPNEGEAFIDRERRRALGMSKPDLLRRLVRSASKRRLKGLFGGAG